MPKTVLLNNLSQNHTLRAKYCASFLCQLRGLTFVRQLPDNWGLLLVQGQESRLEASIHMLFMRIDLAVIWINADGEVVDTCLAKRWRPAYLPRRPARYILETSVEYLPNYQIGDRVQFEPLD